MNNLLTDIKIERAMNPVGAGQDDTKKADTIIDMEGFDEVTFILSLGAVTNDAEVTFQIAQSATDSTDTMTVSDATTGEITSDGTTIALTNKELVLGVTKPDYRYLEVQVVRGGSENVVINNVIAILSQARDRATTQGDSVYSSALHATPSDA